MLKVKGTKTARLFNKNRIFSLIYFEKNKSLENTIVVAGTGRSGTTWLAELNGLAASGYDGLEIIKKIYNKAYYRFDELCAPYKSLVNIDQAKLPSPKIVNNWTADQYIRALNHDESCIDYNPHFRQLLHVSYKIAAEMNSQYIEALKKYEEFITPKIIENLYERHIKKLFL